MHPCGIKVSKKANCYSNAFTMKMIKNVQFENIFSYTVSLQLSLNISPVVCSPSAAGSPLLFSQNPLHAADHTGRAGGRVQGWECLLNIPPSARHLHRPLPQPVNRPVSAWAPWRSSPPQSPSRLPHHLYPSLCPCSRTRRWNRPWSTCEELNWWNEHILKSYTASWHTRLTRPRCRHRHWWPRRWRWSKWSWSSWIQSVPSAWAYAAAAISDSPPQSSWKERDNRGRWDEENSDETEERLSWQRCPGEMTKRWDER